MGGNALKNTETRRYNAFEYHELCNDVYTQLWKLFPKCIFSIITAYRNKPSFGDMDIVISSENLHNNYVELLISHFKPTEWVKNGNVLSFDYKQFQIDLIVAHPDEYHTSLHYFAYNDLGNLCGKLAHQLGVKLGHNGLSYVWRTGTYMFREVVILKDWNKILQVLDLDPVKYFEGFDELEDIFEYVVSSKFFNKDIFAFENMNNYARTRDKKRKTYTTFLDWISVRDLNDHPREQNKDVWLPYLFSVIPGFKETYDSVNAEWQRATLYKEKFNGDLVREWTGLENKELGAFMKWLRESNLFPQYFVLEFEQEKIKFWLECAYKYYSLCVIDKKEPNGKV